MSAIPRSRLLRRSLTVALVGADGAGKSTITSLLNSADLPAPVKTIYMGVNLEASSLMLPTTRLLLMAKRASGRRPDLVASPLQGVGTPDGSWQRTAKDSLRMSVWMLEEWFRQMVATTYGRRGFIIVFDRHFFADYHHADVAAEAAGRSRAGRLHGWVLEHVYPKPDLVICLDAPAEVLHARKPESTIEWLRERRQQYLRLAGLVPAFEVVDVNRPLEQVTTDVIDHVQAYWKALNA